MLMLYLKKELVGAVSRNVLGWIHVKVAIRMGATDSLLEQLALAVLEALQLPTPAFIRDCSLGLMLTLAAQ